MGTRDRQPAGGKAGCGQAGPCGCGCSPAADRGLDGYGLSSLAGSFVGGGFGYPLGEVTEAQLRADFGAFPAVVDAWVTTTGKPGKLGAGLISDGQMVAVTQAVDDPERPGEQTIRLLSGAQFIQWGQTARFPSLALVPPEQGGHGLRAWADSDQPGGLEVLAPPGVVVPPDSRAGRKPTLAGQPGSPVPAAPPGGNPHATRNAIWLAALAVLLVVAGFMLWEAHLTAKTARAALGGK